MKSILALSLAPLGAGWAFGLPGDRPMSGFMAFGANTHTDDELFRNAQFEVLASLNFHMPAIVAVTAVADDARHARRLCDYLAIARALVKAKLPGAAKLVDIGHALETFTGFGRFASAREADKCAKIESRRRLWLSMDDIDSDRCAALAIWCHMAVQQLPELAFHQPKRRASA
jgi:hypothetical protein